MPGAFEHSSSARRLVNFANGVFNSSCFDSISWVWRFVRQLGWSFRDQTRGQLTPHT